MNKTHKNGAPIAGYMEKQLKSIQVRQSQWDLEKICEKTPQKVIGRGEDGRVHIHAYGTWGSGGGGRWGKGARGRGWGTWVQGEGSGVHGEGDVGGGGVHEEGGEGVGCMGMGCKGVGKGVGEMGKEVGYMGKGAWGCGWWGSVMIPTYGPTFFSFLPFIPHIVTAFVTILGYCLLTHIQ